MSHKTFVLPDELGAIINEFSKPVTRPSWKTTVTPSALALQTNFVYLDETGEGSFWWYCRYICLIYKNGSGM